MTVPGVNVIVAATFMAAVGDIRRFADRRKLTAYLGLDPRVRQSGAGPANHGHISKQGSNSARHALVEACWSTVRQPGPIAAFYARVKAKRGHSIAIVASRAQAGLPVLVSAHPRRGLRLRPAVADDQEDAPPRAHRRRPAPPGRPRRLVDQQGDARRRTRTRAAGPARLRTHRRRLASQQGGRERDTGARITKAVKRHSSAADHKPQTICALATSVTRTHQHAPTGARPDPHDLTFIRRAKRQRLPRTRSSAGGRRRRHSSSSRLTGSRPHSEQHSARERASRTRSDMTPVRWRQGQVCATTSTEQIVVEQARRRRR